jgi:hypothetical protein
MSKGNLALLRLARRYVWWQEPERTLAEPRMLLWQLLSLGTAEDYLIAREVYGEAAFREALIEAPPGAVDARSRHFWALQFGMKPLPEPRRRFR